MKRQRPRVRPGDIIGVPVEDGMVAVGIVLYLSKYFRSGVMLGFYRQTFPSMDDINITELGGDFIWTPNYTGKPEITDGSWRIIGNSPELLEVTEVPLLRVVSDLYDKDEIVRRLSSEERGNYSILVFSGGGALENRLRRYFLGK